MIEIDYEFILIFKKPGKSGKVPGEILEMSLSIQKVLEASTDIHPSFGGARLVAEVVRPIAEFKEALVAT